MSSRKLILYIAMSLDGYIATPDGDLSFLDVVQQAGQDYGYHEFVQTVDTVIMSRKTYDKVLSMGYDYPHPDKKSYIITRTAQQDKGNVTFYTGSLKSLIRELKSGTGKNIYCDGGAEIVNILMKDNLIDEFVISIIPIFLGSGISLFNAGRPEQKLKLIHTKSFDTGLVQLHYIRLN